MKQFKKTNQFKPFSVVDSLQEELDRLQEEEKITKATFEDYRNYLKLIFGLRPYLPQLNSAKEKQNSLKTSQHNLQFLKMKFPNLSHDFLSRRSDRICFELIQITEEMKEKGTKLKNQAKEAKRAIQNKWGQNLKPQLQLKLKNVKEIRLSSGIFQVKKTEQPLKRATTQTLKPTWKKNQLFSIRKNLSDLDQSESICENRQKVIVLIDSDNKKMFEKDEESTMSTIKK